MEVPLRVDPEVKYGKEKLSIWANGKHIVIDAPIDPYFYSYGKFDNISAKITERKAKPLSDYDTEKLFYKHSVPTRKNVEMYRSDATFEDNIPFILRVRIDLPDFYTQYPHTKELKFLFFDIEQYTKPDAMFPTYDDRITSISWCTNDRKIDCGYIGKDNKSDKNLLKVFVDKFIDIDPDVVVVFNKDYDIPTLIRRCERNHIDTKLLSKSGIKPYVGGREKVSIYGRVIYDVAYSAMTDQTLSGNVENRGLKEVSNYYGFKSKRKPLTPQQMLDYIGTKTLVEYNMDDVRRLFLLFDVYWENIYFNANDLKIPLNLAVELNTTDLGLITVGDEFRERNVIADGTNEQRYPEIFKRVKKHKDDSNYQGALVGVFKKGKMQPKNYSLSTRYKPVWKADYGSMYPTIESSFDLSPDTTKIVQYLSYNNNFKIEDNKDKFIYYVPDDVLDKTVVIEVKKQDGFLSKLVQRCLNERADYKKRYKKTNDPKDKALSVNRKVKANGGIYGIQGSAHHAFGFAPIAVATCGIGRECAQLLIDILEELYPHSVIEVDTDGVYFSAEEINKKEILDKFNKKLENKFNKDLQLSIDIDPYAEGYFYKAKNYILRTLDGKIIYHGAAMKASSKNNLSRNLIKDLAVAKLDEKDTAPIIDKYLKLDFPLEDFAMNKRLGMNIGSYKNPEGSISSRMALQAKRHLNVKPEIGNIYHYVKTKFGYELLQLANKKDLDLSYYEGQIRTIVEMFDVASESKIDDWL